MGFRFSFRVEALTTDQNSVIFIVYYNILYISPTTIKQLSFEKFLSSRISRVLGVPDPTGHVPVCVQKAADQYTCDGTAICSPTPDDERNTFQCKDCGNCGRYHDGAMCVQQVPRISTLAMAQRFAAQRLMTHSSVKTVEIAVGITWASASLPRPSALIS